MKPHASQKNTLSMPTDFRAIYHLLLEKWWMVFVIVAVAVGVGFFYISRTQKVYAATTTIQVEQEQEKLIRQEARQEASDDDVLRTIEENLKSPALMLRLAHHPQLVGDRDFLPKMRRPASDFQIEDTLSGKISAKIRRGTRLIDVTVEDESPAMAQKIANLLVEEFIRSSFESRAEISQGAHEFLRTEAERLKTTLAKSERALQQYREQHQSVSLEEKQNIVVERLKELSARVTTATSERLKLESDRAQIDRLAGQPPERLLALASVAGAEEVVSLKARIGEKETEMAGLTRRYKSEHPKFIQAASELAELRGSLNQAILKAATLMGTAFDAAKATEAKLEEALRGQEKLALELSDMAIPYNSLVREVESDQALHDSLVARLKQTGVGRGVSQYAVRVEAPALLPERPVRPNKRLILLLSLCTGLAIGLAVALGSLVFDPSVKTVDQAEELLGIRALGAIPTRSKTSLRQARRLLIEQRESAVAEGFRGLRTSLLLAGGEGGHRTLLVTSAVPGEGKSFCAINYAVALAQQGFRTLLIDADLRLPSVGPVFLGDEDAAGLSEVLLKRWDFADAVRLTDIENLSILAAGARVSRPAELIGRVKLADLIQVASERFDRIVIDSAPVHAVSETLLLAPQVDAVCMIVRARQTPGVASARALQDLRQSGANVVGFVLNGLPSRNGGYYYHYHAAGYGKDEVYGATQRAKG